MIEIDDDDLHIEDATPEIASLRQRAQENAAREAYLASLKRRPCGFHRGYPGQDCTRPTCLASYAAHYGDPPAKATTGAKPRRAANRGAR